MKTHNLKIQSLNKEILLGEQDSFLNLKGVFKEGDFPLVGLKYNGEICSLAQCPSVNGDLSPIYLDNIEGVRMYRHTICFILEMAFIKLFPHKMITLNHALGHGFYYNIEGESFSDNDLGTLQDEIEDIIQKDYPIKVENISWREGINQFKKEGLYDRALLLQQQSSSEIKINRCQSFYSLYRGPLLSSTKQITTYELIPYKDGFLLRYPSKKNPLYLTKFQDEPLLFKIYKEYKQWGHILDINHVAKLNALSTRSKDIHEFIILNELLHNKKIASLADSIQKRGKDIQAVFVAGPSSSGKTTFTKKLCLQLRVLGFSPLMISLDNYYHTLDRVPKDKLGKPDFEALDALDIELFNKNLLTLFKGAPCRLPLFNFKTGKREWGKEENQLKPNGLIVVEGIHGLNPHLTPLLPKNKLFRIYISALTQLNLDRHTRISTTDNRLIRRIVRDHQFRNFSIEKTLSIWPSVRRGEDKNIFPNQNTADEAFNSALDYELSILRIYAEPLLKSLSPLNEDYPEAQRLLGFLKNFTPIAPDLVPKDSLLREFIGGGLFNETL